MLNHFNQRRPFTPTTPSRPAAVQPATNSQAQSFKAQIKPDFMRSSSSPSNDAAAIAKPARIKPDDFQRMSPQSQRAALFDQARKQAAQAHQARYQTLRNPSSALPGGLSEKQRMEFQMLQRSDPMAAQKQLQQYQRTSDIRYNKPGTTTPQPPAGSGLTYRRPPTNSSGPRRTFGS